MGVVDLISLVLQLAAKVATDAPAIAALFSSTSAAITKAQAGDGTVSAADWAAIDALVDGDLNVLAAQAGISTPS